VVKGGFALIEAKVSLVELSVVFYAEGYNQGDKVFLRGDRVVEKFSKEVFNIDGQDFILVPESFIQVVKRG
jgi:hypothetical protein